MTREEAQKRAMEDREIMYAKILNEQFEKSVQITDEIVKAIGDCLWGRVPGKTTIRDDATLRRILDAAFNPPPAPKIEVTEAMIDAGGNAWAQGQYPATTALCRIYRAMRALEPVTNVGLGMPPSVVEMRRGETAQEATKRAKAVLDAEAERMGISCRLHRRAGDPINIPHGHGRTKLEAPRSFRTIHRRCSDQSSHDSYAHGRRADDTKS